MGCRFCASALGGFVRNLTAGEMLDQIFAAEKETGESINHIVVMGMGEPFDNYENLGRFLELLHDPDGKNLSYRNITVSTSGIIPAIERFADDFPQVNLAISLHRLDDEGRSVIMPVNSRYPVDELLQAADDYGKKTGRRVTFEYALIKGENDSLHDIDLMKRKLKNMLCHINLIPLNEVIGDGIYWEQQKVCRRACGETTPEAELPPQCAEKWEADIEGACGSAEKKGSIKMVAQYITIVYNCI